jgi:hypothetical protein
MADWNAAVVALLQRVADHFEGTDAPLGIEARRLLAEVASDGAPQPQDAA